VRSAVVAHLPDGLRHSGLCGTIPYDPALAIEREGDCFVAEVEAFDPSDARVRSHFHVGEKLVQLRRGDLVPLVLAYRRSMMEFASATSAYSLRGGDTVYVLGGDGYAGSFECAEPDYGTPVSAVVLGAVPGRTAGRAMNTAASRRPSCRRARPPAALRWSSPWSDPEWTAGSRPPSSASPPASAGRAFGSAPGS
jgi:hypothetical protein